jgi:hypothetical protein
VRLFTACRGRPLLPLSGLEPRLAAEEFRPQPRPSHGAVAAAERTLTSMSGRAESGERTFTSISEERSPDNASLGHSSLVEDAGSA